MILIYEHTDDGKKPVACCKDQIIEKVIAGLKCGLLTTGPHSEVRNIKEKIEKLQSAKFNVNTSNLPDDVKVDVLALQKLANVTVDREINTLKKRLREIESKNSIYSYQTIKYFESLPNSSCLPPDNLEQAKQAEA